MRKGFRSSSVQDQQVLSKSSLPSAVADMYNSSDRPPPLSNLTAYRCGTVFLSFFYCSKVLSSVNVGNWFLNTERILLMQWNTTLTRHTFLTCGKRKCFRTQRRRGKKGGGIGSECILPIMFTHLRIYLLTAYSNSVFLLFLQEQKRCVDSSTIQREVKKVRKARNRRQEWNMMAFDKELRPDHRHPQSLRRGASSEGSLSPDGRLEKLPRLYFG